MVASSQSVKIALYTGPGAELFNDVEKILKNRYSYHLLTLNEIHSGVLEDFQLLIMPGGYTANYIPNLKKKGCKAIQNFLFQKNGQYLGICAGAYIASTDALRISHSKMIRESGLFTCKIKIQDLDHPVFRNVSKPNLMVYYQNGPHMQPATHEKSLALYSDNSSSMIETINAIICSWHPEKLPHTHSILLNAIEYLIQKPKPYKKGLG